MSNPEDLEQSRLSSETISDDASTEMEIPACIRFVKRGADNQLLAAVVDPDQDCPDKIAVGHISGWIRAQGFGNWLVRDDAIRQLARELRRLEVAREYIVAERRDCQLEVQVAPDRLKAWLRAIPAYGGEELSEAMLRQALADQRVSFGINEELLRQVVLDGKCERLAIAEGIAPVEGSPAGFEALVKESDHKGIPQEKEHGRVDYKDLGLFLSVQKDTPLLKRIPPTAGIDGTGVDGNPIRALPGKDRAIIAGTGTIISKDDPDLVVAARTGQPRYLDNSVRIDPTLELDSVDPSTGNVIFEGNVLVRGSVESGFTVKASQDLTILDTVEGANLSAGNNMVLLTGVYGRNKSEIVAGGNIEARFLSDCRVCCGGNIDVADLIAHCRVECGGILSIGKHGGKGQGFGGRLAALQGVQAQILGSISESPTSVDVALSQPLLAQQARIDEAIEKVRHEIEFAEKEYRAVETAEGEAPISGPFATKLASLSEKLAQLQDEKEKLQKKLAACQKARIRATQVHRGVTLTVGTYKVSVNERMEDVNLQQPLPQKPPQ